LHKLQEAICPFCVNSKNALTYPLHLEHLKGPMPPISTIDTASSSGDRSAKGYTVIAKGIFVSVKLPGSFGKVFTVALNNLGLPFPSSIFL